MKFLKLFSFLLMLAVSATHATPSPRETSIEVVSSKYKNLFIFRVDRKFSGAEVEVAYANGDVIGVLKMEKRKLIIDFREVKFGAYVIRVMKGNNIQEFQYIKK